MRPAIHSNLDFDQLKAKSIKALLYLCFFVGINEILNGVLYTEIITIIIGSCLVTGFISYLIWLLLKNTKIKISVLLICYSYLITNCGLPALLMMIIQYPKNGYISFSAERINILELYKGWLIIFLANVTMSLTFLYFAKKFDLFEIKNKFQKQLPLPLLAGLFFIGCFYYLNSDITKESAIVYLIVTNLSTSVLLYLSIFNNRGHPNFRLRNLCLHALTGVPLFVYLGSLSKTFLIYCILPIIIFYSKDKIKIKAIVFISIIFFSFYYIIFPFIGGARIIESRNSGNNSTSSSAALDILKSGQYNQVYQDVNITLGNDASETFFSRLTEIPSPGFISRVVEQKGFLEGKGLTYVLPSLIPRFFWPDKPKVTQGLIFGEFLGSEKTAIGMTPGGELYWNFGWVGVVFGMFLLGYLMAQINNEIQHLHEDFIKCLAFMLTISSVMYFGEWGSAIVGIFSYYLLFKLMRIAIDLFKFAN